MDLGAKRDITNYFGNPWDEKICLDILLNIFELKRYFAQGIQYFFSFKKNGSFGPTAVRVRIKFNLFKIWIDICKFVIRWNKKYFVDQDKLERSMYVDSGQVWHATS
jgi:hypothetical protein